MFRLLCSACTDIDMLDIVIGVDHNYQVLAILPPASIFKRTICNQKTQEFPKVPQDKSFIKIGGEWSKNVNGDKFLFHDNRLDSDLYVDVYV